MKPGGREQTILGVSEKERSGMVFCLLGSAADSQLGLIIERARMQGVIPDDFEDDRLDARFRVFVTNGAVFLGESR